MKHSIRALLIVVAIVAVVAAALYIRYVRQQTPPEASPAAAEQPPPAAVPLQSQPEVRHPIEAAGSASESRAASLPALEASDDVATGALEGAIGRKAVEEFIDPHELVRHIVAAVDGLSRDKVARYTIPVKAVPGRFAVRGEGDEISIDPVNEKRYAAIVRVVDATDAKKLVAAYAGLYPLFQEAFRQLGYPSGYFNDRLIETIDDLLAAPEIQGPIRLVRPKIFYQYADPDLEARSAGQKIMIRAGMENERLIKAKLRQIRQQLAGRQPPQ